MKQVLIVLFLFVSFTSLAQDDIRRNVLKLNMNFDWGASIYKYPGFTYERIIGKKNSFSVGLNYITTGKLYDDATGKDLETKVKGVLVGLSYRRYFTRAKPAPHGFFIEPGVAFTYMNGETKYKQYFSPVSNATYSSNYVTINPNFNIGYNYVILGKILVGAKLNMGYMLPVVKDENRPAGTTYDPVQSKFLIGAGFSVGYCLY